MIDLHTHSTASDGELTPDQLARRAAEKGVRVLAITDHDTIAGIEPARQAAQCLGSELQIIPGVEMSATWGSQGVHVVGLGMDLDHPAFTQGLRALALAREERARKIARDFEQMGMPAPYEGARALAAGALGRVHFARYLIQQGRVNSLRKAFKHYLRRGKPGYAPAQWPAVDQVVAWITEAKGIAVLAHPARYPLTRTKLRALLTEFRAAGGQALEVISGTQTQAENARMLTLARTFSLHASLGSDYHGPGHPWIELGRLPPLPEGTPGVWELFS